MEIEEVTPSVAPAEVGGGEGGVGPRPRKGPAAGSMKERLPRRPAVRRNDGKRINWKQSQRKVDTVPARS